MERSKEIARSIQVAQLQGAAQAALTTHIAAELYVGMVMSLPFGDRDGISDTEFDRLGELALRGAKRFVTVMTRPA